ncbi:MAG: hypothetical protein WD049_03825 [Candidatus Paceibacterota bacterium]
MLFAAAISGQSVVRFDNVREGTCIRGSALAEHLTATTVTDRVLCQSRNATVESKKTILLTGNTLTYSGEIARRSLIIHLERQDKQTFVYGELEPYVKKNLCRLLGHVLTIWVWIIQNRFENSTTGYFASFPEWSKLVAQPLMELSQQDIIELMREGDAELDNDVILRRSALEAMRELMPSTNGWWRARHLHVAMEKTREPLSSVSQRTSVAAIVEFCGGKTPGPSGLGKNLKRLIGVSCDGYRFASRKSGGSREYRFVKMKKA